MKRWIAILTAAWIMVLFSEAGTRLERLKPVELLYLTGQGNVLTLRTDTGDLGRGQTLSQAIEDLTVSSTGHVFLETTEKIIVTEKTLWTLPELQQIVRPATQVCLGAGRIDPKQAAEYLSAHAPEMTLGAFCRKEGRLPILRGEKGRYWLESRKE